MVSPGSKIIEEAESDDPDVEEEELVVETE